MTSVIRGVVNRHMTRFDPSALLERYTSHSRAEYDELLLGIVEEIRRCFVSSSIRFQIKHRIKTYEGYLKKLSIGDDGTPRVARVEDLMGIRIVCPFLEDLDEVERMLSEHFEIAEVDKKHESQSFREFGYDATHLMLVLHGKDIAHPLPWVPAVCEIQLRTILQDAWAEVEHELIYKSEWPIPTYQIRRKLAALNANLTLSDIIFQELREFQREILWKQSKRRSLTDDAIDLISRSEIHTELLRDAASARACDSLEKVIIAALSAHSDESFDVAIALYNRALEMPGVESVRSILQNHRGMAYLALGNVAESQREFLAAIESDPSNHRAWYNLGTVLMSLRKQRGAVDALENCLKLNPAFHAARAKLIRLSLEMGEVPKAEAVIGELRRAAPDFHELGALETVLAAHRKPAVE